MASFPFPLARHLGTPASADPAGQAGDWLQGKGDLLIAGMGGQVPVAVQLGGRAEFSTRAGAVSYLRSQLPLPDAQVR